MRSERRRMDVKCHVECRINCCSLLFVSAEERRCRSSAYSTRPNHLRPDTAVRPDQNNGREFSCFLSDKSPELFSLLVARARDTEMRKIYAKSNKLNGVKRRKLGQPTTTTTTTRSGTWPNEKDCCSSSKGRAQPAEKWKLATDEANEQTNNNVRTTFAAALTNRTNSRPVDQR